MANQFFKTVKNAINYWYVPLIIGLIFIGVGFWTFSSPLESYLALSIIFSISFFVAGLSEIIFAISKRNSVDNWGWTLVFGILTFMVGLLLMMNPEVSMATLPFYLGFVLLFRSIGAIGYSTDLKNYGVKDWGGLMALGIIGIIFSFILLWNPLFAGWTVVVWTGLAFIVAGIISIYLSFKLRKLHSMSESAADDLLKKYEDARDKLHEELDKSKK